MHYLVEVGSKFAHLHFDQNWLAHDCQSQFVRLLHIQVIAQKRLGRPLEITLPLLNMFFLKLLLVLSNKLPRHQFEKRFHEHFQSYVEQRNGFKLKKN